MLHNKKGAIFALTAFSVTASLTLPAQANVVASLKPVGFIAAAIADGVTPVDVLLPDGASEHDYSLRPSDAKRLKNADLVVWVGPEMEAFMAKSAAELPAQKNLAMVNIDGVKPLLISGGEDEDEHTAEKSEEQEADAHHHHHGEFNMHLWLSPEIARKTAVAIHGKLLELMPQDKAKLDANLQQFEVALADTDKRVSAQLAPVRNKGYFVFHDAYTYFEKQYGLSPTGHFTVNPEIQPGAQRLHQIRTQLVEQKAVCVFAEPQFRPAVIDAVARGTQVRKGTLDPLGTDISLAKDSYVKFLSQLSSQYESCLNGA
ncbi:MULTISPECIES: zinc ABC transporter substrate-binding protein ZnuA [Pantoea]|jgi:zinc transport system substrate-binding protein|uniref:High-affinity zinc uptake system protein ZnuA n=1 Tax=[Curtobacterium] plantarum TaxID=221276 RepID=A0ABT9T703_9GAMM|nr:MULTISPECIES: zinc ABC transporter substrate-binding protein ZnuA [Pantoea]AYP22954.1 zinc ABC transporter substrate-binding protein ZnuA [Pantoea agglomerans]AZI51357.1 zinc ABC transporter substrate-binding protein ZnuA [Pantoea agglomerans]EZI31683.1 High-affinity zinc transporter periplasmic component [Pantoea agglomerans]KAF6635218.1 zinc ABC transporter substrate-binding protein ZnuA [Pantoea sp. EKM10T]KDA93318.1 zinc ABC transporter substrate-binding protein [Pantoea agglomerans Eh3